MKRIPWMLGLCCVIGLTGCSSDYVMATKDGKMLITEGKPKIDEDTGLVQYVDQRGHKAQINSDEISSIIEK